MGLIGIEQNAELCVRVHQYYRMDHMDSQQPYNSPADFHWSNWVLFELVRASEMACSAYVSDSQRFRGSVQYFRTTESSLNPQCWL